VLYSTVRQVHVVDPADRYLLAKGVYDDVVSRLIAGSITSAALLFTEARRPAYLGFFTALGGQLPAIAGQLGTLRGGNLTRNVAELLVTRTSGGTTTGFPILITRELDGIWRITGM
jgi:hypothetical protein